MFSKSAKNSERGSGRKDRTLNLTVCGSPVPIYTQQPNILRECKVYKHAPKESKRKEFSFPVDKIIYLTQRLELTSLTGKKIESISLSALDMAANKSLEEVVKDVSCSRGSEKQAKRLSEAASPDFDFSLDLSSIANTADESDENCTESEEEEEEEEEAFFHYYGEKSIMKKLRESSRVKHYSDRSFSKSNEVHDFLLRDQRWEPKPSNCDLITLYINSVNNQQDLVKYFRPCHTCKEPCCICPNSSSRTDPCSVKNAVTYYLKETRDPNRSFDEINKKDATVMGDARFSCECRSCPFLRKRLCCSEFCCQEIFDTDPFIPFCKEECKFRSYPVSQRTSVDSVSSDRILTYTSSLANAAKSARVLARDLELILDSLNGDTE